MKKSEKIKESGGDDRIFKILVSIDTRISNIEERMSDFVTKDNLDYMRNKLEERIDAVRLEVRALSRAVDKDSLAILDFEKRIGRLEKREVIR